MKFVAVEDVATPIEHVWSRVSDTEMFERRIASRVGQVDRVPPGPAGAGTRWSGTAEIMGKKRQVKVTLDRMDAPGEMALTAGTDGMVVTILVELDAQAPTRTRLTVTTEAKARTMTARLMLQSAKLARQTLAKRYKGRVADFAGTIEAGYSPAA
ncbi:MAG: SRPBCC family protein [Pseudomonadota bacterium]